MNKLDELLAYLACPTCKSSLKSEPQNALSCTGCGRMYPVKGGIPILLEAAAKAPKG
jgi:uncharacterized protein